MANKIQTHKLSFTEAQLRELMHAIEDRRQTLNQLIADDIAETGIQDPDTVWTRKLANIKDAWETVYEKIRDINKYGS